MVEINQTSSNVAPLSSIEYKAQQHPYSNPYPFGFFTLDGLGQESWAPLSYGECAGLAYSQNPVAHRCIRLIAEAIGSLKLVLHEGIDELDEHPVLELLAHPNEYQGGSEFLQSIVGYYQVSGDAYIHAIVGTDNLPMRLHALRPDCVSTIKSSDGWVEAFEYRVGHRKIICPNGVWKREEDSILHLSTFNPLSESEGLSALQSAQSALKIYNAAASWNLALLKNSARPSGALVFAPKDGSNLTDDQFARLKAELEDSYTGAKAAGRPLVLEGGLDWKAMGYSPKDMDFIEAKNAAAREIALALGVPPMLLGLPGDNTYSNYQEANRAFWRQTIVPLATRILNGFTHWFRPIYGRDIRLDFDADQVADLASDRDRIWERVGNADFLTRNEKREALGYGPAPAGEFDDE